MSSVFDLVRKMKQEHPKGYDPNKNFPKIYIVSLEDDEEIRTLYELNPIDKTIFMQLNYDELYKVSDGDIVIFLASEDIDKNVKPKLMNITFNAKFSILLTEKYLRNFDGICSRFEIDSKIENFNFLKILIRFLEKSFYAGIDVIEVLDVYLMNTGHSFSYYTSKNSEQIVREIKSEHKKIECCVGVLSGGPCFDHEDIFDIKECLESFGGPALLAAYVDTKLGNNLELNLLAVDDSGER